MSKAIAIIDRPENCQKCWFSMCYYSLPLSTYRKGYSCQLKAEKVVEDFDYDAEVHLQNCPLKENYEQEIRNKAIEEFAEKIELEISESIIWDILATASKNSSLSDISDEIIIYITETIKETAKNIKVGAE